MTLRARLAPIVVAGSLAAGGLALAEGQFKNLQVLPKSISKDELKATMKKQARGLGVECDHCHEPPNMDVETKNKKIAREMMRMTNDINQKFMKGFDSKVTCETCHRGKEKPEVTAK